MKRVDGIGCDGVYVDIGVARETSPVMEFAGLVLGCSSQSHHFHQKRIFAPASATLVL
jgi:hypothetical protein